MLQNPCKTLGFKKNMVYKIPPGGEVNHIQPVAYKPCLKGPPKRRQKIDFQDRLSLNAGQKYCRMLQESILQYFRPSISYHLSLSPLFCLLLSGCLRQVLLLR